MRTIIISFLIVLCTFKISFGQDDKRKHDYFISAVKSKNYTKVEQYISAGVDINKNHYPGAYNTYGNIKYPENIKWIETALMVAIKSKDTKMVTLLIDKGANPNLFTKTTKRSAYGANGYTYTYPKKYPIGVAVNTNNYQITKLLLEKGARPSNAVKNVKNRGNMSLIKLFASHGVDFGYNSKDLENALKNKQGKKYIDFLISQGAKPNGECLVYAVRKGDKLMVNQFIESGVNVNRPIYRTKYRISWYPLCEAVHQGNLDMVKYLVEEHNANLNAKCQWWDTYTISFSLTEFSENTSYCKRRNSNVTEYLMLAPGIQKQKQKEKRERLIKEKKEREIKAASLRKKGKIDFENNNFESGIKAYEDAYKLSKNKSDLNEITKQYQQKAKKAQKNKENSQAEQFYKKAYEYSKNYSDNIRLADFYFETNKYSQAYKIYLATPFSIITNETSRKKGFCKMYLGDNVSAQSSFEYLVKNKKDKSLKAKAYVDLARFFAYTNNKKEAISKLKKAFKSGYRDFDFIKKCNDFSNIKDSQELKDLIGKYK